MRRFEGNGKILVVDGKDLWYFCKRGVASKTE